MDENSGKPESAPEIEKLNRALGEEKKRSEEYLTRLKYAQADFENLKKRMERQGLSYKHRRREFLRLCTQLDRRS
jgi:molecular chaperone GrpE (heat shock protein)